MAMLARLVRQPASSTSSKDLLHRRHLAYRLLGRARPSATPLRLLKWWRCVVGCVSLRSGDVILHGKNLFLQRWQLGLMFGFTQSNLERLELCCVWLELQSMPVSFGLSHLQRPAIALAGAVANG